MSKAIRLTTEILLCFLVLPLTSERGAAQRLDCETRLEFKGAKALGLPALFQVFSEEQKTSVLAEIPDISTMIDVPSGNYSLLGLATMFNPALQCETVDGVLHIFDAGIVSLKGNALNYRFTTFKMPPNVDRFETLLKERLDDEAFSPPQSSKSLTVEMGGGITGDAWKASLREGTYRDVRARNLVLDAARQHVLSSVICFPDPKKIAKDTDVWRFAASHWYWRVTDPTGASQ